MREASIRVEELSSEERQSIVRSLVGDNDARAPREDYRDVEVALRQDGVLVGGLLGHTHWNWLFIKTLWVAERFRGQGLGGGLMRAVEQEAVRRGCLHAHCDTFDFQALPFYQKLGYELFGNLDDYPLGHTRYFLQKRHLSS